MSKEILVEIDENGNCSVKGKNFIGSECDKLISEINNLLGKTLESKKLPEYNQRQIIGNRQNISGGR